MLVTGTGATNSSLVLTDQKVIFIAIVDGSKIAAHILATNLCIYPTERWWWHKVTAVRRIAEKPTRGTFRLNFWKNQKVLRIIFANLRSIFLHKRGYQITKVPLRSYFEYFHRKHRISEKFRKLFFREEHFSNKFRSVKRKKPNLNAHYFKKYGNNIAQDMQELKLMSVLNILILVYIFKRW